MLGSPQESLAIPGAQGMSQRDMGRVMANPDMSVAHGLKAEPTKPSTLAKQEANEAYHIVSMSVT